MLSSYFSRSARVVALLAATTALAAGCDAEEDFPVVDEESPEGKADTSWYNNYAGSPTEYDVGPNQSWAELFAAVPNYRDISRRVGAAWLAVGPDGKTKLQTVNEARALKALTPIPDYTLTKDKFRFEMAPIFYRGRLDGTAKVLVVGQDAATDEALVHRAFVGGTGQKVQHLLNQIGITRSYVAVNTFIYSIFEQYDEFSDEIAMTTEVKDFRNQVMKKVWDESKIELIVSFGSAAHDSVRKFRDEKLGGKFPPNVKWVTFLHPGAAAVGQPKPGSDEMADPTALNAVMQSFANGYAKIWGYKKASKTWLQTDQGAPNYQRSKYYYMSADIPYVDLPYGFQPEIGRGGTKSERAQSGMQVQLRSAAGVRYEAPDVAFPKTIARSSSGIVLEAGELAWEPPKVNPGRHDPGPGAAYAQLFATTPALEAIESETGIMVANDFKAPVWYRGDLGGTSSIKALVLMQDTGIDQFVAGRAAIGDAGQKINHLLRGAGIGDDYLVLSVFPYNTANVAPEDVLALAQAPSLVAYRNALLQKILLEKQINLVITVGAIAEQAFAGITYTGTRFAIPHPSETNAYQAWNPVLRELKVLFGGTQASYRSLTNARVAIPREHLPWGKPMWFGTSGDLSQQAHESWLFWNAPKWVNTEPPLPRQ